MIRKANVEDFDQIYPLIMSASKLVFVDALQSDDENELRLLVKQYFYAKNNKFSYENTIVYVIDNLVVGCLVSYESDLENVYNLNMENILNNGYKYCIESLPNTMYLDTIAVDDNYQGKGIAKTLIEYLIESTKLDVSLIAESYKTNVIAYYKKLGFEVISEDVMFGEKITSMLYKK